MQNQRDTDEGNTIFSATIRINTDCRLIGEESPDSGSAERIVSDTDEQHNSHRGIQRAEMRRLLATVETVNRMARRVVQKRRRDSDTREPKKIDE